MLDSGNDFKVQSTIKASDYAVTGLRFRGDSSIIATTADGKIGTWHSQTGKVMHMIEDIKNPLMCIDVNYNNTLFAVGGHDKVVKLYDDETKTLISELVGNYNQVGHSNRIFSVNFHKSNPNLLASGGWDSIVVFYDTRQKEIIGNCLGAHICGDALDMKDNYVLTGSYKVKDQIKIFDIRKFELVETVNWEFNRENHTSYIYCAQFSKSRGTVNNYFAVGGSGINQFRVFDDTDHSKKDDKKHVKDRGLFCCEETPGQVYSLDFSNNLTNILAVGCGDGIVRVYDVKD